jgi:L-serine deaminase
VVVYFVFLDLIANMSFDKVVQTMKQTGKDLSNIYKETSGGGLVLFYPE